ncbi:phospholipase D active site-containing protein [Sodiomyces alkalinus F11]|uniref:Phospholipase D active site-containing protein n=1 Tax=Sodiomyces alkalinus (strain CBS 110278 / VKM F-3762 / F11) TaxID=1314773 RepID=A0A3N2Q1Z3_SODAK|nr:phospholipase D active site-containing protein [Sodiomyces alkalinus F11]ROT40726.1 phospholipase D active site-containing protein [Sodiomyces alkalinus F11]
MPPTPLTKTIDKVKDISEELYHHCSAHKSVSLLLAKEPSLTPSEAWDQLYGKSWQHHQHQHRHEAEKDSHPANSSGDVAPSGGLSSLDKASALATWGKTQPSDLFLQIYGDSLRTIDDRLDQAVVSPSLMGTSGTVPLTIISTTPDIARHMSNLIVRAEKEILLFTNYWQNGVAATFLTNALRELSRRVGAERRSKVVVKLMYDRGSLKQFLDPHHEVAERDFTDRQVALPRRSDIPHLDLHVMNYHRPLLGTFHAKFTVVDRRIALVQSNNVQDTNNLEMAVQFEGPVVDSIYDMALITWSKGLGAGLPLIGSPATGAQDSCPSWTESHERLFDDAGRLRGTPVVVDPDKMTWTSPFAPIEQDPNSGTSTSTSTWTSTSTSSPAPESDIDLLPEHHHDDPHYDHDQASEILRVQASVTARPGEDAFAPITRHLNHTLHPGYVVLASHRPPDFPPAEQMTPYLPHPPHDPVPMALVNRPPYGFPNNQDIVNPQNAAWLSALRNAQHSVFIQTPTLNAEPLLPAITEACERGVDVWCYISLGYNDTGELLPMQGGHNELISHKLHTSLPTPARSKLHYNWYVAKDHAKPLVQWSGPRASHVKLLIADERVAILGSGNQDTQTWCHSQEANLMVDSPPLCRAWIDALRRVQNTAAYGAVDRRDGVWRDPRGGREVEGALGVEPGWFSWAKGVVGAVRRVQGKGGFG